MNVLFASSECAPIIKVGGLGDVVGSLPKALGELGVNASVVIPAYKPVIEKHQELFSERIGAYEVPYGGESETAVLFKSILPGTKVPLFLIQNSGYLSGGGVYYNPTAFASTQEEIERFAFFSKAVVQIFSVKGVGAYPVDLFHCNDWHTGIIPKLLGKRFPSIFTIHNLANQGFSNIDVFEKLGMDISKDRLLSWDAQDDNIDFILQGIIGANYVNTVSPTYAKEIQTKEYGEGLHEVIKGREGRVFGILNGIDYDKWDPKTDGEISQNFDFGSLAKKYENKGDLQKELGLEKTPEKPVISLISRLTPQKGIDLLTSVMKDIQDLGAQLVILGSGDPSLENRLRMNSRELSKTAKNVSVNIGFDAKLARRIYAGSDMFLIPSRFEPCGLTQMISMRYGTIPIVRRTGGLSDTVRGGKTGFVFEKFNSSALLGSIKRALSFYRKKAEWKMLIENAMKEDFSWKKSAGDYKRLYELALSS